MFAQDFFLKYYDWRPFHIDFLNRITGNISKILGKIANRFLPWWFKKKPGIEIWKKRKKDVNVCPAIITMTSFPSRIKSVPLVIEVLLRQQMPPSLIVLYLSECQFYDKKDVEHLFANYIAAGVLQLKWVKEDIKSHKKYWYALTDFPYNDIITVDDDIMYQSDTISTLYESSIKHPYCIPALYIHQIERNDKGDVLPYSLWSGEPQCFRVPQMDAFFGSGGGTYFPLGSLQDANQPIEVIQNICPLADDIWLNAITRKNGYIVVPVSERSISTWGNSHDETLSSINNGQKKNDEQLFSVIRYFEKHWEINPFKLNSINYKTDNQQK